MINTKQFENANQRAALRKAGPTVTSARYDRRIGRVVLALSTGIDIAFSPKMAQGLETATPAELSSIEISPSGLGIHFPSLDADLYLPALLEGTMGSETWSAARIGAIGGAAKSKAKGEAARRNGARGGRPKRATATA